MYKKVYLKYVNEYSWENMSHVCFFVCVSDKEINIDKICFYEIKTKEFEVSEDKATITFGILQEYNRFLTPVIIEKQGPLLSSHKEIINTWMIDIETLAKRKTIYYPHEEKGKQ